MGQAPAPTAALQTHSYLQEIWQALRGDPAHLAHLAVTAKGALPSVFCVTDLANSHNRRRDSGDCGIGVFAHGLVSGGSGRSPACFAVV
jgi:hypothetical protein